MKFRSSILCITLLALTAVPTLSQTPTPFGAMAPPHQLQHPVLTVTESVVGWFLNFAKVETGRYVVILMGTDIGPSRFTISPTEFLWVDVTAPVIPVWVAGPCPRSGSLDVYFERPKTIDAALEGITVAFQGVSMSLSSLQGRPQLADLLTSNARKVTLTSGSLY